MDSPLRRLRVGLLSAILERAMAYPEGVSYKAKTPKQTGRVIKGTPENLVSHVAAIIIHVPYQVVKT
jgi:hypothetical protein